MNQKTNSQYDKEGTWLTVRPDIRVLDCTIRDGGLVNNCNFEDGFVKAIYNACVADGVDYMEIGYKADRKIFTGGEFGIWKFCDEDDIRRIVGDNDTALKISVMADAERTNYHEDILPKDKSVIDLVRVACYIHQIPTAMDMVKDAHDKGYETTINLMASSVVQEKELDEALAIFAASEVDVIYLVDSYGALYGEDVRYLVRKYLSIIGETGKKVGVHTHNNQQLAYANTIEGLMVGASYLDATISGLGRGAGNCPMELLLGFLKNPKFHLRPVLQCIQETIVPFRQTAKWGYEIPYMLTGQLNVHPRTAIAFLDGEDHQNHLAFYDRMMEDQ
jgi:4-hydroxy 2-oxovalerate aldolase